VQAAKDAQPERLQQAPPIDWQASGPSAAWCPKRKVKVATGSQQRSGCCQSPMAHELPASAIKLTLTSAAGN